MKRQEFIQAMKEYRAACAVLDSGMPQANDHERRGMRAKKRTLHEKIAHAPWQEETDHNGNVFVKER